LFEIENDELTMVAVDGYRLALRRESIERSGRGEQQLHRAGAALPIWKKLF
jgi:DNA polymerase III sliding clamp (beta) subunit (PCNA family)